MGYRLAWIVIYLNLPLLIAVGILGFAFGEWGTVKILLGVNVGLLLTAFILCQRGPNLISQIKEGNKS